MSHISYEWQIFIGYLKGSILIVGLPVFWKLVLARFPVCPGIKTGMSRNTTLRRPFFGTEIAKALVK